MPQSYVPGTQVWVYDTITNADYVTPSNPTGLVDADPVTVTVTDPTGAKTTVPAVHMSLGLYRALVALTVPGGSYTVMFSGSGLGGGTKLLTLPVGRAP